VFDEGKTSLAHKEGEVLLIDVWATWCPPCQKPMSHNQEMLERNEERWKGKVKIVGVSVDDSKETIKARVEQKGWNRITHLTLLGWKGDHELIKDFKIQGIPFVCLVDKFGRTNYIGHPMGIVLELRINELLAQTGEPDSEAETAAPSESKAAVSSASSEELNKLVDSFSKENVAEVFKDVELFCFTYALKQTYNNGAFETALKVKTFVEKGDENGRNKAKQFFG
jgi:thiol-disulfide isomerase/thioredoxin